MRPVHMSTTQHLCTGAHVNQAAFMHGCTCQPCSIYAPCARVNQAAFYVPCAHVNHAAFMCPVHMSTGQHLCARAHVNRAAFMRPVHVNWAAFMRPVHMSTMQHLCALCTCQLGSIYAPVHMSTGQHLCALCICQLGSIYVPCAHVNHAAFMRPVHMCNQATVIR